MPMTRILYKAVRSVNDCLDMSDDIPNIEEWQMQLNISKYGFWELDMTT